MHAVLCNSDLVACILAHADLDPSAFTAAGRVSTVWRAACRADTTLLLAAARRPTFLTKRTFTGLFALTPMEADAFPRGKRARLPSGIMYMYRDAAINGVFPAIGGLDGWKRRLTNRSLTEHPPGWRTGQPAQYSNAISSTFPLTLVACT